MHLRTMAMHCALLCFYYFSPPTRTLRLAVHSIDFFNQTNLLYGSIDEFCDENECTEMRAGPQYVYLWASEEVCCVAPLVHCHV